MRNCNRATITTIATVGTLVSLSLIMTLPTTIGFAPSASNRRNFGVITVPGAGTGAGTGTGTGTGTVPVQSQLCMALLEDPNDGFDWESNKRRQTDQRSATPNTNTNAGSNNPIEFPNDTHAHTHAHDNPILPILDEEEIDLTPHPPSTERSQRMEREKLAESRFIHGDELFELRKYMQNLRADLFDAREKEDAGRIRDLITALHESQMMDAEQVYLNALNNADDAEKNGLDLDAKEYREEAILARECLPQFQLGGLWVGKYGENGYEMVNVTYVGDTLIATKITGDQNVPKGEITFTADLRPKEEVTEEDLEPIELSDIAAKQWGHKYLPRYVGQGQAADEGFINSQWMDGQLILVGEYFSFAWIPLGHQIFFGRPSAELTLKMLKQSKMSDFGAVDKGSPNPLAEMRAFAQRCLDETELMIFDEESEGELCFATDEDGYFSQDGCFE